MSEQPIDKIFKMNFWDMHNINNELFLFFNGLIGSSSTIDTLFIFITNPLLFITLGSIGIWFVVVRPALQKDPRLRLSAIRDAGFFIFTFFVVFVLVQIIKTTISFPRPHEYFHGIRTLLVYGEYDSFPSLHASFSFALATLIYQKVKWLGGILFIIAVLVSFSRVYVGVHFPIDILVGAFLGISIPLMLTRIFKK